MGRSLSSFELTFGVSPCVTTVQAARYGDMEDVRSYLSQGVSPDAVDIEGRTALFFAAANGHLEIVDVLLEKDAVSDGGDCTHARTHTHHDLTN
jgi:hypothetical protein